MATSPRHVTIRVAAVTLEMISDILASAREAARDKPRSADELNCLLTQLEGNVNYFRGLAKRGLKSLVDPSPPGITAAQWVADAVGKGREALSLARLYSAPELNGYDFSAEDSTYSHIRESLLGLAGWLRDIEVQPENFGDGVASLGPDEKADDSEKNWAKLPRNPKVIRLGKWLRNHKSSGRSDIELALDFTEGNRREAQSLLRKLRDYPHLKS